MRRIVLSNVALPSAVTLPVSCRYSKRACGGWVSRVAVVSGAAVSGSAPPEKVSSSTPASVVPMAVTGVFEAGPRCVMGWVSSCGRRSRFGHSTSTGAIAAVHSVLDMVSAVMFDLVVVDPTDVSHSGGTIHLAAAIGGLRARLFGGSVEFLRASVASLT